MSETLYFGKNKPLTSEEIPQNLDEAINAEGINQGVPVTTKTTSVQPAQTDDERQIQRCQKLLENPRLKDERKEDLQAKIEEVQSRSSQNQDSSPNRPELDGNYGQNSVSPSSESEQSAPSEVSSNTADSLQERLAKLKSQPGSSQNQDSSPNRPELDGDYGQNSVPPSESEQSAPSDVSSNNDEGNNFT